MSAYEVCSKGKYQFPQSDSVIPVESFILVREGEEKYLLLRFTNTRAEELTGLNLYVTQYDKNGAKICARVCRFKGIKEAPSSEFVLNRKISVSAECAECRVRVDAAQYGRYTYSAGADGVTADYDLTRAGCVTDAREASRILDGKCVAVSERSYRRLIVFAAFALLMISCIVLFSFLHIKSFKDGGAPIMENGVTYEFVNGEYSEGGEVRVTGSNGKRTRIFIPKYIDNHRVAEIAPFAFKGDGNIKSVSVEGLTKIGESAFADCVNLESVQMPDVTAIGANAFSGCVTLTDAVAYNLSEIGDYAFFECRSLKTVLLSGRTRVLTLGAYAFAECEGLENVTIEQPIIYPQSAAVFLNCKNITFLTLENFPDGCTVSALFGNRQIVNGLKLKYLKLGSLNAVSDGFCEQTPLETFVVENLKSGSIGDYAFYNTNLKIFSVSRYIRSVGDYAFYNTSLSDFAAAELEEIGDFAFCGSGLSSFPLEANASLVSLGASAFAGCVNLAEIYIPASVTALPPRILQNSGIARVTFAENGNLREIGEAAFDGCVKLENAQLPSRLRTLGSVAFRNCSGLQTVDIPEASEIGAGAFMGCDSVISMSLPFIGGTRGRSGFFSYIFGAGAYGNSGFVPESLKEVTITDAEIVPPYSFYQCRDIERIYFSDGLIQVGVSAFYECRGLKEMTLPDSVEYIGKGAFNGCDFIERLSVPFIGGSRGEHGYLSYIFGAGDPQYRNYVPDTLKSVTVTTEIYKVDGEAFYGLNRIEEIVLPQSVSEIGDYAFYGCSALGTFEAPLSLQTIGDYAFSGCAALTQFTLQYGTNYIGDFAFYNCYNLKTVYNLSSLSVTAGSPDNGYAAYYATDVFKG